MVFKFNEVGLGLVCEVGLGIGTYGYFYELGVLFVGVLIIRALLFEVYITAPCFWKLPYGVAD